MRRLLPLLALLALGSGLAQAPALWGPPLPAPYEVQDLRVVGERQIILASFVERAGPGKSGADAGAYALLLARDRHTGRTLWKQPLVGWKFGFGDGQVGPNTVTVSRLAGRQTCASTFDLNDGKKLGRHCGVFIRGPLDPVTPIEKPKRP